MCLTRDCCDFFIFKCSNDYFESDLSPHGAKTDHQQKAEREGRGKTLIASLFVHVVTLFVRASTCRCVFVTLCLRVFPLLHGSPTYLCLSLSLLCQTMGFRSRCVLLLLLLHLFLPTIIVPNYQYYKVLFRIYSNVKEVSGWGLPETSLKVTFLEYLELPLVDNLLSVFLWFSVFLCFFFSLAHQTRRRTTCSHAFREREAWPYEQTLWGSRVHASTKAGFPHSQPKRGL